VTTARPPATGLTQRVRAAAERLYSTKLGGFSDTTALLGVGAGVLASSPYFATSVPAATSFALPFAGGLWLSRRVMRSWASSPVFPSHIRIKSAASPMPPPCPGGSAEGLLVGYTTDTGQPIWLPYLDNARGDLRQHVLMLGQSGVGKTVSGSLMMFQHIQAGGGLIWIDGKLDYDNLQAIYSYAAYCGRESDLLVVNPGDPERSNTYNAILHGDPDEVASRILALIPSTETNPGADYYKQEANKGLITLLEAIRATRRGFNFLDLSILLNSSRALMWLRSLVPEGSPERAALQLFLEQFRGKEGEVDVVKMRAVFGGIGGRLFTFGTGNFGKIGNTYSPEVVLTDAIRSNKLIYVMLPTMARDLAATNFGKMFVGDLRSTAAVLQQLPQTQRPWPPVFGFFDEAGSYINVSWNRMFEQLRSSHIFMMPAAQTIANFMAISEELKEMIIGNTWTKIVFQLGTRETAVECADLIGQEMQILRSLTLSGTESESMAFLRATPERGMGASAAEAYAEREQEGYRVRPEDLMSLGKGRCVMTFGGQHLYHLTVPKVDLAPWAAESIGEARINRFRTPHRVGLCLFENIENFLTQEAQSMLQNQAAAQADTSYGRDNRSRR